MARPQRCRRVCSLPKTEAFSPIPRCSDCDVIMTIDEYEVIRLIDLVGLTQEQCARQIEVSRTTVTGIYDSARYKMADALVHGKRLLIEGGHIKMCEYACTCDSPCCHTSEKNHKGE